MIDIQKEVSEILRSRASDSDKIWMLARLIQRLPEALHEEMGKQMQEEDVKRCIEKSVHEAMQDAASSLDMNVVNRIVSNILKDIKGESGKKGDKGERGDRGEKPVLGVDYRIPTVDDIVAKIPKPKDGKDGYVPVKNKDYFDGYAPIKGKDYFDGKDGKDGREIEPKEIVKKLESLSGNSRLSTSAVRNLDEKLQELMQMIRRIPSGRRSGVGGGMGDVKNETNNTSSATTTLTTAHMILGGAAVWLDYNGQTLARGTHFTVGSDRQTITLLFTPEDATTIQVIYIVG
jgi:hypothetical protein